MLRKGDTVVYVGGFGFVIVAYRRESLGVSWIECCVLT